MMMNDGPDFLWQAARLVEGDWSSALSHPYHPLYAGLTALVSAAGVGLEASAIVVALVGGLLTVLAAWGLARLAFPDEPAAPACAALVAAVAARFVEFGSDVQSDGLFAGLALSAVWATVSAARRDGARGRLALAGVLAGLTYLVRPEGLFLALLPASWVVASPARLVPRAGHALAFAGGLLLLVTPYVVALHEVTGVWGLSLKPSLAYAGLGEGESTWHAPADSPLGWPYVPPEVSPRRLRELREAEEDATPAVRAKEGSLGGAWPFAAPVVLAQLPEARGDWPRAVNESVRGWLAALRGELLLLLIPGVVVLVRRNRRLALGLLVVQLAWLGVTTWHLRSSDYITNRHYLLAQGMLLPVCGAGLIAMWRAHRVTQVLAVLALLVSGAAGTAPRREENGPRLEALAWVREHTTPDQLFATHRHRDGWYAERVAVSLRMPVHRRSLLRLLEEHDLPYLVLDEDKLEELQPDWLPDGDVVLVERFEGDGETVLVLRPSF